MLLIHGFTGSPPEMRLVGEYLHRRGLTVYAPLLPGHGTTVEDMNRLPLDRLDRAWGEGTGRPARPLRESFRRWPLHGGSVDPVPGGAPPGTARRRRLLPGDHRGRPAHLSDPRPQILHPRRAKSPDKGLTDPEADLRLWSYEENPVFAAHELLKLLLRVR